MAFSEDTPPIELGSPATEPGLAGQPSEFETKLRQFGRHLLAVNLEAVPDSFVDACQEIIFERGPDIRASLELSDPQRREQLQPLLALIDVVHPEE
jgi:hypothetical protein